MFYYFMRALFRFVFAVFTRFEVISASNLPHEGPVLVVSNHMSNWDPLLLGCAMDRRISILAKAELFKIPVLKTIIKHMDVVSIKRGQSDIVALRTTIGLLASGKVVGIFPEGTRSPTGEMQTFKSGVAMIAYKAGCPIVPVGIVNSKKLLLGWVKPVKVIFGEAFIPEKPIGKANTAYLDNLSKLIEDKVRALIV